MHRLGHVQQGCFLGETNKLMPRFYVSTTILHARVEQKHGAPTIYEKKENMQPFHSLTRAIIYQQLAGK
jgi:hypothetical protein